MRRFYRRSDDSSIVCECCLPQHDDTHAVELRADLFPGTFHALRCAECGASPDGTIALTLFAPKRALRLAAIMLAEERG